MSGDDRWTLSTGKVIEDNLYAFGKTQIGNHPSQSLIFDVGDFDTYVKKELPDDIKQYLDKFHYHSTADIRKTTYFGNLEGLEINRKSRKRTTEDVNNHDRKPMSHRFDFLIRKANPESTNSFEYDASEIDKSYNLNGNKMIQKRVMKLPKVLKDILDLLVIENKDEYNNLGTVCVVHSGWTLLATHSVSGFFESFNFCMDGDPTHDFVQYVNQSESTADKLTYTQGDQVVMKTDNTTANATNRRQSVRITSKALFESGLFAFYMKHISIGCSTWLIGPDWPNSDEIDISLYIV
ncbi:MAG: hypothetical protein EXX96DRAFT_619547 [Benjaminiella poitrasii]|nr:MAG: hypothetical protein EXX96DRAFT_619547 [Benjaminiella poitrasii]